MMRDDDQAPQSKQVPSGGGRRKPYTAPTLTLHGPVETITGTIGLNPGDVPLGSTM